MRLGQLVYFKHEGLVKIGFIKKELGDDLIIISENISYTVKAWQIKKVPDEKNN